MIQSTTRRQLILVVMVALSLALTLSLTVFTPIKTHAQAAAQETLTVPFTNGPNGATTTNSYTGTVTINVSGTGQAAGPRYSDAFYIFTDDAGNPITPVPANEFGLYINGRPAPDWIATGRPDYNGEHVYQFNLRLSGQPVTLTFGIGDMGIDDNSGAFIITVTQGQCPPVPGGGNGVTFYAGANYQGQKVPYSAKLGEVNTIHNLPAGIAGHLGSFNDPNQAWHVVLYQGPNGTGNLGHYDASWPNVDTYWQNTQSVKVYHNLTC